MTKSYRSNFEKIAVFDRKGPDGISSVYPSLRPTAPVSGFGPLVPFETTMEPYGSMVVYSSGFTPEENLLAVTAYLIITDNADTPEVFIEFHSRDLCEVLGMELADVYASTKALMRRIRRGKAPVLKGLIDGIYAYLDLIFQWAEDKETAFNEAVDKEIREENEAYEERHYDLELTFLTSDEYRHIHGSLTEEECEYFFPNDDEDIV